MGDEKDERHECPFSTSCYRRNPHHFKEYTHSHLKRLLSQHPSLNLPSDTPLQSGLSLELLGQQLKLFRDVERQVAPQKEQEVVRNGTKREREVNVARQVTPHKEQEVVRNGTRMESEEGVQGQVVPHKGQEVVRNETKKEREVNVARQVTTNKEQEVVKKGTKREREVKTTTNSSKEEEWECSSCTFINEKIEVICGMCDTSRPGAAETPGPSSSSGGKQGSPGGKKGRVSSPSGKRGRSPSIGSPAASETGRPGGSRGRRSKIQAKLAAAAPYNYLLACVADCPESHKDSYSVFLAELLHPSLGNLASSLQINFMVELDWLTMNYELTKNQDKPLVILYGAENPDLTSPSLPSNIRAVRVKPKYPYGTHHTKMMVLLYTDGSLRVVVSTANLVASDWENRTQGLWVSDLCPRLEPGSGDGESVTGFKASLLRYLRFYEVTALHQFITAVQSSDMSGVKVALVTSVPGSHKDGAMCQWGHRALAKLLRQNMVADVTEGGEWPLTVQCSSIGSLGTGPDVWFQGELGASLASRKGNIVGPGRSGPPLRLVYPSRNDVLASYDGVLGGGCLPYSGNTAAKQPWLERFCHHWRADASCRTRAMPHIKTYTRSSPDHSKLAYFVLTSANLSKAAWGSVSKAGNSCLIMSYEAGVVWLPRWQTSSSSSLATVPFRDRQGGSDLFPLHYDLPLTKYGQGERPWLMDYMR